MKFKPTADHADNYANRAWQYARDAVADKRGRSHCKWIRLAAQRFLDDLAAADKRGCAWWFSPWHANDPCDFIEKLPHIQGEWGTRAIVLGDVQCFILCIVFGFRRTSDDRRRFSFVYIEAARKFAKSTLSAAVALYCLCCDDEIGPQIVIGATTGDQAGKVFEPARLMVNATPPLAQWFNLETFVRSVVCHNNAGSIQPINAKASSQDGWNPSIGILDELHAHKSRGLFDVIRSSFGARQAPIMWIITTAGYDAGGVCFEQRTMITKVLQGLIDSPHVAGFIFTIDDKDDPYDESVWIKANPLIGVTPTLQSMREYARDAQASPGVAFEFRTKRLNVWTTAKDAHFNIEHWKKCQAVITDDELAELPCWAGLDLAATSDLAALVMVWRIDEGAELFGASARYAVRGRFYLPADTIDEHTRKRNVTYRQWVDEGWITATPGAAIDQEFIEADIVALTRSARMRLIGYDPWNAVSLIARLTAAGVPMVEMRAGARTFNAPMKLLDGLMRQKRITHNGNPVLTWTLSNVVARRDVNENLAPDRRNSHEKIDGAVAMLMALGASELEGAPQFEAFGAVG